MAKPRRGGEGPVGGVPGRKGAAREMVAAPGRVEELRPREFCQCGTCLDGLEAVAGERRQQIEMPEPKVIGGFRAAGGADAFCVTHSV